MFLFVYLCVWLFSSPRWSDTFFFSLMCCASCFLSFQALLFKFSDPVDPVGDPVDPVGDPVDPVDDPVDPVDPVDDPAAPLRPSEQLTPPQISLSIIHSSIAVRLVILSLDDSLNI